MIILITGASHTGKTRLAQKMLEKYHFPLTDDIRVIVSRHVESVISMIRAT